MARQTVADAITRVARNMSLVNGQGMTPYSDELIWEYVADALDFISEEFEWDELRIKRIRTLDGVTGRITEGITEVSDWKEVMRIYHESSMVPLPKVTNYSNQLISTTLIGYEGLSRTDDPGPSYNLVNFYPLILTGRVMFVAKVLPDIRSDRDAVLPVDWLLHVYHASWQYALDDGTNPGQVQKYDKLYKERLKQIAAMQNSRPVSLDPYAAIPDIWFEGDDPYWISAS